MKKKWILQVIVLLSFAGIVAGQDDNEEKKLGVTLDVTYLSSFIFRGGDAYPEGHSAIQPSINVDLYGTGFGFKVFSSRANKSGFENFEWLYVNLYYYDRMFEDEKYAMDYLLAWVYYNFPDNSSKVFDVQEACLIVFWPNICPGGFVPNYKLGVSWPARSNSTNARDDGGWVHVFGLGYDMTIPPILPNTTEQLMKLSAEVVYNDGIGPAGELVDHDWSYARFSVATPIPLSDNLTFTPKLNYQISMDDSVNDDDETWVGLSMTYKF